MTTAGCFVVNAGFATPVSKVLSATRCAGATVAMSAQSNPPTTRQGQTIDEETETRRDTSNASSYVSSRERCDVCSRVARVTAISCAAAFLNA